ncbi:MAG: hypothetical protein ACRDJC_20380 [Thermomicrobiales bacterium]
MQGTNLDAVTRKPARSVPIDRKTALKILGGSLALLTSARLPRPSTVMADHDGT